MLSAKYFQFIFHYYVVKFKVDLKFYPQFPPADLNITCFLDLHVGDLYLFYFPFFHRGPNLTGYGVVLASDWMTGSTGRTGSHRF